MSQEKKIVSIEDRIPKLKQARKKKANRRLIFYVSVFFVLISIVVYLQSPLSHVQHIEVVGNQYLPEEEIKSLSSITNDNSFWGVDKNTITTNIEKHPEVKAAEIEKHFPTTIQITIEEFIRVGYIVKDDVYFPLLENGKELSSSPMEKIPGDAPLLIGFDNQLYLQEITKELANLPRAIVNLISEVSWEPTDENPYKVRLYMNDGLEVEASIRNFTKSMSTYPSIAAQIDEGRHGVIRIGIGGGAVFTPYEVENDELMAPAAEEDRDDIEG